MTSSPSYGLTRGFREKRYQVQNWCLAQSVAFAASGTAKSSGTHKRCVKSSRFIFATTSTQLRYNEALTLCLRYRTCCKVVYKFRQRGDSLRWYCDGRSLPGPLHPAFVCESVSFNPVLKAILEFVQTASSGGIDWNIWTISLD